MTPYPVFRTQKSVGLAITLTLIFGSLGLFYASILGGFVMTIIPLALIILFIAGVFKGSMVMIGWSIGLLILFLVFYWIINILWAIISVNNYNREIEEEIKKGFDLWVRQRELDQNQVVLNFNNSSVQSVDSNQKNIALTTRPTLQEWLKQNPGKSINDYYAKVR